jgi:hypothetical protein
MKPMQEPDQPESLVAGARRCPACGSEFVCGIEAGEQRCWCADLPSVAMPEAAGEGCYCPDCLQALIDRQKDRA